MKKTNKQNTSVEKKISSLLNEIAFLKSTTPSYAVGRIPSHRWRDKVEKIEGLEKSYFQMSDGYTLTNDDLFTNNIVEEEYDFDVESWVNSAYSENELSKKNAKNKVQKTIIKEIDEEEIYNSCCDESVDEMAEGDDGDDNNILLKSVKDVIAFLSKKGIDKEKFVKTFVSKIEEE